MIQKQLKLVLAFVVVAQIFVFSSFGQEAAALLLKSKDGETIVARVTVRDAAEMLRVVQRGLDLMEHRDGDDLIFWTTEEELNKLRDEGFRVRVDEQQTAELRRAVQPNTFRGGYRTVEETQAFLDQLQVRYPNLTEVFTYGQSWEKTRNPMNGYDLFGIKLTNRNVTGNKPTFLLEAGIHARELTPVEIASRFAEYLLTNYGKDADATWLLDEHLIVIVPIVNPDGRKIAEQSLSKRKNTNNLNGNCSNVSFGIDLNRNFSWQWGTVNTPSQSPCSETFPGLTAASEPETQGIQNLMNSLFPDQRGPGRNDPAPLDATGVFLDIHSYGNLVLYPWGDVSAPPPNLQLRTIAQKMASYNGYNPIQAIGLYATSGTTDDHAYGDLGIAGFGFEVGSSSGSCGGFFAAYTCLDGGTGGNFWNLNRPALLYLAKIARTPYITGEGATAETLTVTRNTPDNFALRAQISDQANGNQAIAAAEVYIDTPPWRGGTPTVMTAEDGSFNSSVEYAVANVTVSPGRHIFYVRGRDAAGNWGAIKAAFTPRTNVVADFDGDGKTDLSVFRQSEANWYLSLSQSNSFRATQFGLAADKIAPADYDGDGRTDVAVYRAGLWYILNSSNNAIQTINFGITEDAPVPADYDGDGRADLAVFRRSSGAWYILRSSDASVTVTQFGLAEDVPAVGDYDADGKADLAVWRPSTSLWYLLRSRDGFTASQFGLAEDKPVVGDYDGDGKSDLAVWRPSNATWYVSGSQTGFVSFHFGLSGDVPTPGDFDGDGKTDFAVWRPETGVWYLQNSTSGFAATQFGISSDKPVPAAYGR